MKPGWITLVVLLAGGVSGLQGEVIFAPKPDGASREPVAPSSKRLSRQERMALAQEVGALTPVELERKMKEELGESTRTNIVGRFVVATNQAEGSLLQAGSHYVETMAQFVSRSFFDLGRANITPFPVYLFEDEASYVNYCKKTLGQTPPTPFGFYLPRGQKLIMNASTGLGTLTHEMVHPLLLEDFPAAPLWFNEGFASLFEAFVWGEKGEVRGTVNPRLLTLQKALSQGTGGLLKKTMTISRNAGPMEYAVGRYLCLYLQEHDQLQGFYKLFRDSVKGDPTGVVQLEKIVGCSLDQFEPKWESWIQDLSFGKSLLGVGPATHQDIGEARHGRPADAQSPLTGFEVGRLIPGSPAEKAGVLVGDLITHLNGKVIANPQSLLSSLMYKKPGEVLTLTIKRGAEVVTQAVTLAKRS